MASPFRPVLLNAGANDNQGGDSADRVPKLETGFRRKRILHVEFDRTLLATRHVLLETAGFEVISCFSGMAAREVSAGNVHFDVFLLGHAASVAERTDLVIWMKSQFPGVAVVVLRARDTDGAPGGGVNVVSEPEELLKALVDILKIC